MPGPTPNVGGDDAPSDDSDDGVRIDMISGARMDGLTGMEKIRSSLTESATVTSSSLKRGSPRTRSRSSSR